MIESANLSGLKSNLTFDNRNYMQMNIQEYSIENQLHIMKLVYSLIDTIDYEIEQYSKSPILDFFKNGCGVIYKNRVGASYANSLINSTYGANTPISDFNTFKEFFASLFIAKAKVRNYTDIAPSIFTSNYLLGPIQFIDYVTAKSNGYITVREHEFNSDNMVVQVYTNLKNILFNLNSYILIAACINSIFYVFADEWTKDLYSIRDKVMHLLADYSIMCGGIQLQEYSKLIYNEHYGASSKDTYGFHHLIEFHLCASYPNRSTLNQDSYDKDVKESAAKYGHKLV
jgi:hypothetical protein